MKDTEKRELKKLLNNVLDNLIAWDEKGNPLSKADLDDHLKNFQCTYGSREPPRSPLILYVNNKSGVDSNLKTFIFNKFKDYMPNYVPMRYVNCSIRSREVLSMDVSQFLKHLIYTVFYKGVERTVKLFERSTKKKGVFKIKAILEGIKISDRKKILEGVALEPLTPHDMSELPSSIKPYVNSPLFRGGSILIIEAVIFPIFHKSIGDNISDYPFKIKIKGLKDKEIKIIDFLGYFWEHIWGEFRYALSLAHNEAVHIPVVWSVSSPYEIFNSSCTQNTTQVTYIATPTRAREATNIEMQNIEKIDCKYKKITNQDNELMEKLRIPIHRWIASKGAKHPEDQLIDLGIALEAIFLFNFNKRYKISKKLASRASRYLESDQEKIDKLRKKLKIFYWCRSEVVHGKKLEGMVEIGEETIELELFIRKMQDVCRDSILRILKHKKFPCA